MQPKYTELWRTCKCIMGHWQNNAMTIYNMFIKKHKRVLMWVSMYATHPPNSGGITVKHGVCMCQPTNFNVKCSVEAWKSGGLQSQSFASSRQPNCGWLFFWIKIKNLKENTSNFLLSRLWVDKRHTKTHSLGVSFIQQDFLSTL